MKAVMARTVFYNDVKRFFADYDLLLTPAMPVGAWSVEPETWPQEIEGRPTPHIMDHLHFTYPSNLTGQPAATVPCGFTSEGLPVGLQIVGPWHADATVLRASACFESIQPWSQHHPPSD
jgi:Asp-tRNA(Asn)/Glu-tRNA(Gln) amidotransferase A subunit family amidase